MDDTPEGLDECRSRDLEWRIYLYGIHARHSHELRQPAGWSGDSVLAIKLALMTVLRATVLTKNLAPPADTVQSLVHHDAIALAQIRNRCAHLFDYASDLVTENLRLQGEWY